ncbi:MAG: hypothetical protein D5R99_07830 [Methanocalculus sp. MSAO_Arc1]|uniref:hypothetical protein n=1 Tax=Methanocalculus TaxID=71151 RepID=UPI000FF7739F|nr:MULTISPECIES: hypothetical protein [unclassified Methanocalculus]MCP1663289.1 hypothetical protein [Methanocalculus sp. AMF5]RQD79548.1 MAG: hypothetical protein D5R99_07830 [Methanocalculus sp. MSAO_Arc1]
MDARMKFLEHELEEKEREMEKVKREDEPVRVAGGVLDERITALEKKVRELEAMLKGLMDETLDLKSVTRKIVRNVEERDKGAAGVPPSPPIEQEEVSEEDPKQRRRDPRSRQRVFSESEPPRSREQQQESRGASPAPETEPPVDTADMELIMQPDGTLKPEKRVRNDYIVASSGYAPATQMKKGKIESKIYEAPDDADVTGGSDGKDEEGDDTRSSRTIRRRK